MTSDLSSDCGDESWGFSDVKIELYNSLGGTTGTYVGNFDEFEYFEETIDTDDVSPEYLELALGKTSWANTAGYRYLADIEVIGPDGQDYCGECERGACVPRIPKE